MSPCWGLRPSNLQRVEEEEELSTLQGDVGPSSRYVGG
jgi:hypothetical protein